MIVRALETGKDAAGLTRYLFGPGKANEHTNQRMLAGSSELMGEWSGQALSMREATHLGRIVEAAWRRQYAPELALAGVGEGGISRSSLHSDLTARLDAGQADGAVRYDLSSQQDHVFHATISLHPSEGPFTDDQWNEIATKYMEGMGFAGREGGPDASWYAVHHGLSKEGNDHIHVVACTTLRDGTRVDLHNSGRRSQEIRRNVLERLPYVKPLHEANRVDNAPRPSNFTAAEHNIARERAARGEGPATPDRVLLQRILRAAATEATTEAAFINNVTKARRPVDGAGLDIVAARWAPGGEQRVVTGYKVRFQGGAWFSASTLAPDLTLGKLRPTWAEETESSRAYASGLWAEQAAVEKRVATPDVPAHLAEAAGLLKTFNADLMNLDPHDVAAWRDAERAAAGTTSVLATGVPQGIDGDGRETGFSVDAGRASDVLTRQWLAGERDVTRPPRVPGGLSTAEVAARHLQLALRSASPDRHAGWFAVMQQMIRTMNAIADARQARGEVVAATTLRRDAVASLERLNGWLDTRVVESGGRAEPGTRTAGLSPEALAAREAAGHARGANAAQQQQPSTTEPQTQTGRAARRPGREAGPRRGV